MRFGIFGLRAMCIQFVSCFFHVLPVAAHPRSTLKSLLASHDSDDEVLPMMEAAARSGQLHILKWLCQKPGGTESCAATGLFSAGYLGYSGDIYIYIYSSRCLDFQIEQMESREDFRLEHPK